MDLSNNCEKYENNKAEFKVWLKSYKEQLSNSNKSLKNQLQDKQHKNNDLKLKIEELLYNNLDTSMIVTEDVPNKAHSQIEEDINKLKTKMLQVKKCNETIDTKFEEEIKKFRKLHYEIIIKDELSLKPYHEVEKAVTELTQKMCCNINKQKENKEIYILYLKDRAQDYLQIKAVVAMLEPIAQELKVQIANLNENVEEKLKVLNLKCAKEACNNSSESKELLYDIDNLKAQLNKQ